MKLEIIGGIAYLYLWTYLRISVSLANWSGTVSCGSNIVANCDGNGTVTKSFVEHLQQQMDVMKQIVALLILGLKKVQDTQPTGPNYSNEGEAPEFVVIDEVNLHSR